MKTSESIKEISAAFCLAQAEMGGVINNKQNPAFKNNGKLSTYADFMAVVEAVKQPFCNNDLAYMQFPISNLEGMGVVTRIMHKSGEWIESEFTMPLVKVSAHGAGSNFTYARRYALSAACGLPTQDDDGNAASLVVEPSVYIDDIQAKTISDLLEETNADTKKFCAAFQITSPNKMPKEKFDRAIADLNKKKSIQLEKKKNATKVKEEAVV
ncbi:hypothetical protein [uncultured Mediterranean phage uvMED]|nr:hypothetical protein [uncultured Mediterranean phage uvMED]